MVAGPRSRRPSMPWCIRSIRLSGIWARSFLAHSDSEQTRPQLEALRSSRARWRASGNTLVILGFNPVYTAPADLEFAANLKKVANVVYLGSGDGRNGASRKMGCPGRPLSRDLGRCASAPDGTAHPAADDPAALQRQDRGGSGRCIHRLQGPDRATTLSGTTG